MKYIFCIIILGCNLYSNAQVNQPLTLFDIQSYTFNIEIQEKTDTIKVAASIGFMQLKYDRKAKKLVLNFKNKNKYGKGMVIESVYDNHSRPLVYSHNLDLLTINLPSETTLYSDVKIYYKGIPENGMIIGKNKFGDKTWFGDNWPNRAQYWLPCVDHPADKAKIYWEVVAPKGYEVVANGNEIKTMSHNVDLQERFFEQEEPIATKVATIGIAKLEKKESILRDNILVANYMYPQTYAKQPNKMDVANEILTFFEKVIGKYPFQKLNNVQSTTMFGGMENANNIFYDEYSIDSDENNEALIAHEIAHQWFGNTVTEKDFSHLWLSEGFATFFTNYYLEKKYGVDTLNKRLADDVKKVKSFLKNNKRPVVDSTKDYMSLLNANSYQKGGLFLQALRVKLTEPVFIKIIQTYFTTFKYKNATTNDFLKIANTISKSDLTSFFKQWLYSTELPSL